MMSDNEYINSGTADASEFRRKNPKATNSLLEAKLATPALKAAMRVSPIQSAFLIGPTCQGKTIKNNRTHSVVPS
jgi:hypothetical protein